jgi:hypothetical protein
MYESTTRPRVATLLGAALALSILPMGAAHAAPGGSPAIPLNNGQETTGANTGAHGSFSYEISGTEFCYTLSVTNLSAASVGAHVHVGDRRTAGPVVIPLEIGSGTSWTVEDCTTASSTLLAAIEASPRSYYVNVHTPLFPGGEVRGQLK